MLYKIIQIPDNYTLKLMHVNWTLLCKKGFGDWTFWSSLLEGKVEKCCRGNASPISPQSMVQ